MFFVVYLPDVSLASGKIGSIEKTATKRTAGSGSQGISVVATEKAQVTIKQTIYKNKAIKYDSDLGKVILILLEERRLEQAKREKAEQQLSRLMSERESLLSELYRVKSSYRIDWNHRNNLSKYTLIDRTIVPFCSKGFCSRKGQLSLPVEGQIIHGFGEIIVTNNSNTSMSSRGLYIASSFGTVIHVIDKGVVIFANYFKGYGNLVIVDHGDGYFSVYAHTSQIIKNVGSKVVRNEAIALVGDIDVSNRPMLYFELRYYGKVIDPSPWFINYYDYILTKQ